MSVCGICGFKAKTVQGLAGHMRFKHSDTAESVSTQSLDYLQEQVLCLVNLLNEYLKETHPDFIAEEGFCGKCGEDKTLEFTELPEESPWSFGWVCKNCGWVLPSC